MCESVILIRETIILASSLKYRDLGTDPFVELRVKGEETFNRTSPKLKTHDPHWNESFQL